MTPLPPMSARAVSARLLEASVTFRELFSPTLDGTYRIRSRESGRYLTGTKEGFLGTSLHHVGAGPSDWKLKRMKRAGRPAYTLQNKDSKRFLVAGEGQLFSFKQASEAGYWNLNLGADGVFWSITSATNVDEAMTENVSGSVELLSSAKGGKNQWFLDLRQSVWRIPKGDSSAYKSIWITAADIPMWAGTELTWSQACQDGRVDCATAYSMLRTGLKVLGKISETHRRIVLENAVQPCDVTVDMISRVLSVSAKVVEELRKSAGQACNGQSLTNVSNLFKEAVTDSCFASCVNETTTDFETQQLSCNKKPDNVTTLLMGVMTLPGCKGLPPNTIEKIAEFAQGGRCQPWPKPSLLWLGDTDGPTSIKVAEGRPTCSVKAKSRSYKDIERSTTQACPSGSTCQCPKTYRRGRQSIDQLKNEHNLFIGSGEGSLAALAVGQLDRNAKKLARNMLLRGGTLAANAASLSSPLFFARIGWDLGKVAHAALKWSCADTVACWPQWPEKTRTADTRKACRVPAAAKSGGSSVWFMPPPGVMVKKRSWYRSTIRRCEFSQCEQEDMMRQRVGFGAPKGESGRPNVYNCQFLEFDDMSAKQQKLFVDELKKTNQGEYNNEPVFQ